MEAETQTLRPKAVRELPPEVLTSLKQVRRQHLNNLLAILDKCLLSDDPSLTAGVCSVALAAVDLERYQGMNLKNTRELPAQQLRIGTVVNAITEVVLRQQLPPDQIRRQLQQLLQYQPTHLGAEQMMNSMAMLQLLEGNLDAAYQQLLHPGRGAPSVQASMAPLRSALCAVIRHQQWHKAMQALRRSHLQSTMLPSSSTSSTKLSAAASAFMYDERMWVVASSSNDIRDAWRECEIQLKEALNMSKGNTLLSLLLVHTYIVSGRMQSALQTAQAAAAATPHDADAHTLLSLVQQLTTQGDTRMAGGSNSGNAQGRTQGGATPAVSRRDGGDGGDGSELSTHVQVATFLSTLQIDPLNMAALSGLTDVQEHCLACQLSAAEGCLLYLDMEGVVSQLDAAPAAWAALARSCAAIGAQMMARVDEQQEELGSGAGSGSSGGGSAGSTPHVLSMWRQLRLLLAERATWWPVLQLQPTAWSPALGRPHTAETAQHVLFVAAVMLGPHSSHVQQLAHVMRQTWQQTTGTDSGNGSAAAPPVAQINAQDSYSISKAINQGTAKAVEGPAWVDAALQQATDALTAEQELSKAGRSHAAGHAPTVRHQEEGPYEPNPEWFRPLSVVIPLKRRRDRQAVQAV